MLERVRDGEGGEMLAALLAEARPVALEDDVLVLAYPRVRLVQQAQDRGPRPTASACGEALRAGRRARRSSVRFELTRRRGARAGRRPRPPLTEEEVIARIKSEFDAEDVADEKPEQTQPRAEDWKRRCRSPT